MGEKPLGTNRGETTGLILNGVYLLELAEKSDSIVSKELDIKPLKGIWDGFSRLRVGKIRVIFLVDLEQDELFIYLIDFRGDVY